MSMSDNYYIIRQDKRPDRLFASFNIFKSLRATNIYKFDERPPYPILNDRPTVKQVISNLNKSDFMVYLAFFGAGLLSTILVTRNFNFLADKFYITRFYMLGFASMGIFTALNCSYYRLIGFMDNGLRWKNQDFVYNKYDFTRDFEKKTIFKYLRERAD
jgi:hypothetical protein